MKKTWIRVSVLTLAAAMLSPSFTNAQKENDDKAKVKKDVQQIIITKKGDKEEKIVVEINGDKVLVNGKPLDDLKDGNVKVHINKLKDLESLTFSGPGGGHFDFGGHDKNFKLFSMDNNRAMLGVSTETADKGGVVIKDVTKGSAAEKTGLKKGDIITKIGDDKIENPDDLSEAVQKHKPGDKIDIKYIRDGKEQKTTAELTKWKGVGAFGSPTPFQDFNFNFDDFKVDKLTMPRSFNGQGWSWSGNGPKLGLSVQDTDDGKGVKVIEVEGESNAAKAGIKEEDVITHLDDKEVNNVDEISKLLREKKENLSVRFQLNRNGKSQNIEVKMPRKIKTADL